MYDTLELRANAYSPPYTVVFLRDKLVCLTLLLSLSFILPLYLRLLFLPLLLFYTQCNSISLIIRHYLPIPFGIQKS
jgi:hypothetical protein